MSGLGSLLDRLYMYILFHQRWIFLVFVLPASVAYDLLSYMRFYVVNALFSAPHKHGERVKYVQRQIEAWREGEAETKMVVGYPGWTDKLKFSFFKKRVTKINVAMHDILEIDQKKETIRVEPSTTLGQITSALLPLGWTLPVLPEMDDLTVCSLVNSVGFETSSHIYGLFKDTCVAFDIITADGELHHCTETENTDLFYAIPSSHNTLGFLVAVEIKIVHVKAYVKLEYLSAYSGEETVRLLNESCKNRSFDFVEGLMFSETAAVIVRGKFEDPDKNARVNHLCRWWKPWFYTYAEKFLKKDAFVEFVPTHDYYHRHTRAFFWLMGDIVPFANNPLFRYFFGWSSPPSMEVLKLTLTRTMAKMYERTRMVQDMFVPISLLEKTLLYVSKNVKIYPLWLCPVMCFNKPGLIHPSTGKDELYVNIGAYGNVGISDYHPIECTRAYEAFVRRIHGHQMLYADSYQTRDEFAQMFDRSLYDLVRCKLPYCQQAFPDIFDKTTRSAKF